MLLTTHLAGKLGRQQNALFGCDNKTIDLIGSMRIERLIDQLAKEAGSFLWLAACPGNQPLSSAGAMGRMTEVPLGLFEQASQDEDSTPRRLFAKVSPTKRASSQNAFLIEDYRLSGSPLALLNAAFDCLAPEARLLMDMAFDSLPADPETRQRHLGYLIALAYRCGFIADDQQEPCESASCVIRFRKDSREPRWRLDLLNERDLSAFSKLFREIFNTEISQTLWHWKYGDGRGHGVIARRGDRVVAHYGCTRRRALMFDKPITALQMCDVMVDPRERAVMTKQGAFFLTTATLLEIFLGLQAIDLPFGFPNARAARIGERLGLYAEVGRILEIRWPATVGRPRLRTRVRVLDKRDPGARGLVERLWSTMREDLKDAILVIRDWDYLSYRYLDHPENQYDVMLVTSRLSGRPLGILVLRRVGEALELLDVVGPLANIPRLVDQAQRLARLWGFDSVFCWITQQHLKRFTTPESSVKDPDVIIPTNIWVDGPDVESLRDTWWLMSGDTEFR